MMYEGKTYSAVVAGTFSILLTNIQADSPEEAEYIAKNSVLDPSDGDLEISAVTVNEEQS